MFVAHQGKPFLAAVAADPSNSAIRLAMFPVLNSSYSKPYIVMLLLLVARSGANRKHKVCNKACLTTAHKP